MFKFLGSTQSAKSVVAALNRSQAVIEFDMEGKVIDANTNFLETMGWTLPEIIGKHHSIFVEAHDRDSAGYQQFWQKLRAGEYDSGQYRRVTKAGQGIWLQASYNPVLDSAGKPMKVIKFATDITAQRNLLADLNGQIDAINKAQAVIQFDLNGTILDANENFTKTVGYTLDEIKGRHHSLFVDAVERDQPSYKLFWDRLRRGEFDAGQYRRMGKGGRELWLQATYNPIFDADGRVDKVVKFANDVTEQVKAARIEEVVRSTLAAVDAAKAHDLTQRVALDTASGDVRLLASGVNDLLDTLSQIINAVSEAAGSSLAASSEIASGSHDLAMRTGEQASALEESAATIEQLAASVKSSAQNSQQALREARSAEAVAGAGGEVVSRAVNAMTRIEDASGKITAITDVIEEIAFQTNLLALNAAVEAARAGDAGRGFAVVASEVRVLAQRSSAAAKDIGGLITSSGTEVAEGVKLVRQAGDTLGQIVSAAAKVAGLVSEVAQAGAEQANGIDDMSQSIAHLDGITQQNAALSEQSAASASSLSDQISSLSQTVAQYKTSKRENGQNSPRVVSFSDAAAPVSRLRAFG